MKPEEYLKQVEGSEDFKSFKQEDPKSYFCSAFFVRDFEGTHNENQIDYYSPKSKKIFVFKIDEVTKIMHSSSESVDINKKKLVPKEIKEKVKMDIDQIPGIILDEMHNKGLTDKIKKIIVVLQHHEGRAVWNCTCFLDGMGLLQTHIEDKSETVLFMDKRSFFDMIIPLKKGQSLKDALKGKTEKKFDPEKVEGNNEGFIG
jgi:hypothetical protein